MDSVSHIRVAHLLLDHVEQTSGVTFDRSAFVYGLSLIHIWFSLVLFRSAAPIRGWRA